MAAEIVVYLFFLKTWRKVQYSTYTYLFLSSFYRVATHADVVLQLQYLILIRLEWNLTKRTFQKHVLNVHGQWQNNHNPQREVSRQRALRRPWSAHTGYAFRKFYQKTKTEMHGKLYICSKCAFSLKTRTCYL